jgi:hypothetical protein
MIEITEKISEIPKVREIHDNCETLRYKSLVTMRTSFSPSPSKSVIIGCIGIKVFILYVFL